MNFKVTLPFHIMRQAYAAFEKRPPWPLQPYFEALKCYKINIVVTKDSQKYLPDTNNLGYPWPRPDYRNYGYR
jgi:hypothetical protein